MSALSQRSPASSSMELKSPPSVLAKGMEKPCSPSNNASRSSEASLRQKRAARIAGLRRPTRMHPFIHAAFGERYSMMPDAMLPAMPSARCTTEWRWSDNAEATPEADPKLPPNHGSGIVCLAWRDALWVPPGTVGHMTSQPTAMPQREVAGPRAQ